MGSDRRGNGNSGIAKLRRELQRIRKVRCGPRTVRGCASCARTASRASAKSDFPPRATRTGASRILPQSRRLAFSLLRNGHALPSRRELEPFRMPGAACQLVFVDGRFAPELSIARQAARRASPSASLAAELARNPGAIEPHLGRYLDTAARRFRRAEHGFLEDGAYVHVAKGTVVRRADPSAVRFHRARCAD